MTKQEYLQRLRALLRSLPHQEVERICTFYAESIDDRMESGLSESDAVASMETPGTVAEQIIDSMPAVPAWPSRRITSSASSSGPCFSSGPRCGCRWYSQQSPLSLPSI